MTSTKQPGFQSLIDEHFQIDSSNLITGFLEKYAEQFVKGFASSKAATTIMGTAAAASAEVEIPLAAMGALISQGFDLFNKTTVKDNYKSGDVCLFFNGYWPTTPAESASLAMEMVDDSFEPLAEVARYDVCMIVERLEGEKGYTVYDLANKMNRTVQAKDLRPEQGNTLSKFDIIGQLKEKFTNYIKPSLVAKKEFKVGNYVCLRGEEGKPDQSGTIISVSSNQIFIKQRMGNILTVERKDWPNLLSDAEIEGKRNITEQGRSDFRVQQICLYPEGELVRPCIIIQLKPHCKIRTFHQPEPIQISVFELLRASSSLKDKMFKTAEYRRFIDMVAERPFDQSIPLVTEDISMLGFEDRRRIRPTEWHEEAEIIPASIETRQYSGHPGLELETPETPAKRQSTAQVEFSTPMRIPGRPMMEQLPYLGPGVQKNIDRERFAEHPGDTEILEPIPEQYFGTEPMETEPVVLRDFGAKKEESNSMMPLVVGAVIIGGAFFLINK